MQLPPTVNLVLFFSVLPSLMSHTIRTYVAPPLLFLGVSFSSIKNIVIVPSTRLGMTCASLPISLPKDLPQTCLYWGLILRCLYLRSSPVDPSRTAPAILYRSFIGNFRDANCLGVASVDVMSMQESMTSCVRVRHCDLVFLAGASVFSSCVQSCSIFFCFVFSDVAYYSSIRCISSSVFGYLIFIY